MNKLVYIINEDDEDWYDEYDPWAFVQHGFAGTTMEYEEGEDDMANEGLRCGQHIKTADKGFWKMRYYLNGKAVYEMHNITFEGDILKAPYGFCLTKKNLDIIINVKSICGDEFYFDTRHDKEVFLQFFYKAEKNHKWTLAMEFGKDVRNDQ